MEYRWKHVGHHQPPCSLAGNPATILQAHPDQELCEATEYIRIQEGEETKD